MKKILIAVLLMVGLTFAAAPANDIVDGAYMWDIGKVISDTSNFDSLKTAVDSSTILTKWIPEQGYEYMLAYAPITGTSVDSLDMDLMCDAYSSKDTLLYRTNLGSHTDDTDGSVILVPFGGTLIGSKFSLKWVATNGGTALNAQLNTQILYRRRVSVIARRL